MIKRLAAVLFTLLLVAAGCSSSSDETAVASTSAEEAAESEAAAAPDTASDEDDDNADDPAPAGDAGDGGSGDDETPMSQSSPIGAFFSDGGLEQSIADYTIRVEEEIVRCMAAEGFEFKQSGQRRSAVQEQQNELSEREWTKIYGYGISTSFDSFMEDQTSDPNSELFFSMQPGEREAWMATLLGEDASLGGGPVDDDRPIEEQGCVGQGIIATGGQEVIENLEGVGETYEEGLEGIYDEPSMIDAVSDWTRCMSEAGYPDFSEIDAPEESIGERLEVLTAGLGEAMRGLDPEEGEALIAGDKIELENLPNFDVEALRKLQDEEVKLAVADLDCFEVHVEEVFNPLRDAFENGILDEYQSELTALKNIGS